MNNEQKIAAEAKRNYKALWNFINSLGKTKQTIFILKMTNGEFTKNGQEKAQSFQYLFASVFTSEYMENGPS